MLAVVVGGRRLIERELVFLAEVPHAVDVEGPRAVVAANQVAAVLAVVAVVPILHLGQIAGVL